MLRFSYLYKLARMYSCIAYTVTYCILYSNYGYDEFCISVLVIIIVEVNLEKIKDYTGWLCVDCHHLRRNMRYKSFSNFNFYCCIWYKLKWMVNYSKTVQNNNNERYLIKLMQQLATN